LPEGHSAPNLIYAIARILVKSVAVFPEAVYGKGTPGAVKHYRYAPLDLLYSHVPEPASHE